MDEKKNKPEIRFKGFTDDWLESKLGELGSVAMNRRIFKNQTLDKGDVPFYKIGTFGSIPDAYISRVLFEEYKLKYPYPEKGELLISASGSIGRIDEYFQDSNIVWLQHDNRLVNSFLKQFYSFVKWSGLEGSTIKRLYNKSILDTPISLPQPDEQTKLGTFFNQLDTLITYHQQKYNKLITVKKAMLEKMFPQNGENVPEIRFKGFTEAWEVRKFGECVLIQRGGSPRPIENFTTNDENGINWIKIGDVAIGSRYITKTKEKIIPEGEKHSRKVQKGDLILSNSMSFGRPYIMAIDGCIHDGWLLIRDEKNMFDLEYLLQLLSSDYMLTQYRAVASGGVVINLNSELVQSTNVFIPNKNEQHRIGKYFSELDNLITLQQRELEKLKNIKKACLEKMFV